MSYIEKNILQSDEKIIKKVELHPLKLVLAWIAGILFCWLLLIPTIKAIKETIRYKTTELVITDKKVIEKYGLFNTSCDEMPLEKIENITSNQTFWGKIFGYGNIYIQGTNKNNIDYIGIKNHEQVRTFINQARNK